jgi:hypothetical protein
LQLLDVASNTRISKFPINYGSGWVKTFQALEGGEFVVIGGMSMNHPYQVLSLADGECVAEYFSATGSEWSRVENGAISIGYNDQYDTLVFKSPASRSSSKLLGLK